MKVSHRWLNDYCTMNLSPEEYKRGMLLLGFGIEGCEPERPDVKNILVGYVAKLSKHPNADKLFVCQVDIGKRVAQLVTGATNLFEGAYVPVALPGTVLPNGVKIEEAEFRGVVSEGMLCSGEELKFKNSDVPGAEIHGILVLPGEYTPGEDLLKALHMDDLVYDFEILANRPDCLSILGLARETAVLTNSAFKMPSYEVVKGEGDIADVARVTVLDSDLCPRYCARVVRDIRIAPSPEWMQQRLRACGVRPINNIVDITNYVMLEFGQPMHAFDLACVHEGHIIVRRARENETVVTLDGKKRTLTENMLVIADPEGAVGLAGVMGGENSEITENTKAVLFESAQFTAANIRVTSKALGMSTEASARYAKGVDAVTGELTLQRAVSLVHELGAGQVVGGMIDVCARDLTPRVISVRSARVSEMLAYEVSAEEIERILTQLGMTVNRQGDTLQVTAPYWRGDFEGEADVAEEVGRVHGFDRIPSKSLAGEVMRGGLSQRQKDIANLRAYSVAQGANEVITFSFIGPSTLDKLRLPSNDPLRMAVPISNPFGEDQSLMRTTLIPGMLQVMATNANRRQQNARFFEVANVQFAKELPIEDLPEEKRMFSVGLMGKEDFYSLKGFVESILEAMGVKGAAFETAQTEYMHPGRCARLLVDGKAAGFLGEVHPLVCEAFELDARAYVAEVDIGALCDGIERVKVFTPLPRYLSVKRDIALVVEQTQKAGELETVIRQAGGEMVESVALFDVYEGERMEKGTKSLAYTVALRGGDHTLTDAEIQEAMTNILAALERRGAKLRQ